VPDAQGDPTIAPATQYDRRAVGPQVSGVLDEVEFTWALPDDGGSRITSAEVSVCNWHTGERTLGNGGEKVPATASEFTATAFTWRASMAHFIDEGFYWSDTPRVSVKFNNYLGGVWPDRDVTDGHAAADCRPRAASYSSTAAWGALHLMTAPAAVVDLAEDAARTDAAQITATWAYPLDVAWTLAQWYDARTIPTHSDGAAPLTHYVVKYYAQSRADLDLVDGAVVHAAFDPDADLEVTLTGTEKGRTYHIGVTAVNSMGSSSEAKVAIQQAEEPALITNGETSQLIQTRLDLSFKKNYMRLMWWPDDDGGADVIGFEVRVHSYRQVGGVDAGWVEPATCASLTFLNDRCFVDIQVLHDASTGFNVPWGDTVTFQVRSRNAKGWGDWSESLGGAVLYWRPEAPTGVSDAVAQRTYSLVNVTFTETPAADWRGSDVNQYNLYRLNDGNDEWVYLSSSATDYFYQDKYIA